MHSTLSKNNISYQELIEFDKRASAEKAAFLQESMLDWETRRSDALLDLRRKHLQELAKHAQVSMMSIVKFGGGVRLHSVFDARRGEKFSTIDAKKRMAKLAMFVVFSTIVRTLFFNLTVKLT
jgi:hypothetical protein